MECKEVCVCGGVCITGLARPPLSRLSTLMINMFPCFGVLTILIRRTIQKCWRFFAKQEKVQSRSSHVDQFLSVFL